MWQTRTYLKRNAGDQMRNSLSCVLDHSGDITVFSTVDAVFPEDVRATIQGLQTHTEPGQRLIFEMLVLCYYTWRS